MAATLVAATACCGESTVKSDPNDDIPIACVLAGMTKEQRDREAVLLEEHVASVREVKERDDGYSFRYDSDIALFSRMAELVALEHRCCPFLEFELAWGRANAEPWLHIRGGARVKEFVLSTFAPTKT